MYVCTSCKVEIKLFENVRETKVFAQLTAVEVQWPFYVGTSTYFFIKMCLRRRNLLENIYFTGDRMQIGPNIYIT